MSHRLFIAHLQAHHIRNLQQVDIAFTPGINVFIGDNGQGKTNLLEAIALGSGLKPLRPVKQLKDVIQAGQMQGALSIAVAGDAHFDVHVTLAEAGKKVLLAGKPIRDAAQLAEQLAVVTFVPDDLAMVTGSASYRRKALDQLCYGLFPSYLTHLRAYDKALTHRNHVLKQPFVDTAMLASFTQLLLQAGALVVKQRLEALAIWQPYFQDALALISNHTLHSTTAYAAAAPLEEKCIAERYAEERIRKTTLFGPHLDDVLWHLNDQPARHTASRGQARALVLAFKIAQLNAVAAHRQISPILLLDDVASELDPHNAKALLTTVHNLHVQTFITTTHADALPFEAGQVHVLQVERGSVGLVNT